MRYVALLLALGLLAAPAHAELSGEQLFLACAGCHTLQPGEAHGVGPNLYGIAGQPAGSRPGFDYSPALVALGEDGNLTWSEGSLVGWILQAEAMAPGTWMLYNNILEAKEVQRLARYVLQASRDSAPAGESP